jgi:hypothetical protein
VTSAYGDQGSGTSSYSNQGSTNINGELPSSFAGK